MMNAMKTKTILAIAGATGLLATAANAWYTHGFQNFAAGDWIGSGILLAAEFAVLAYTTLDNPVWRPRVTYFTSFVGMLGLPLVVWISSGSIANAASVFRVGAVFSMVVLLVERAVQNGSQTNNHAYQHDAFEEEFFRHDPLEDSLSKWDPMSVCYKGIDKN